MSNYTRQQTGQPQQNIPQPVYPPKYGPTNPINQFVNNRQQQSNYQYPTQQYPPQQGQYSSQQGQYPPQYQQSGPYPPQQGFQQQGGYPIQNPYDNFSQRNAPQRGQYNQPIDQYQQNPIPAQVNPDTSIPPPIPQNSPLLRHSLSQIVTFVKKNIQQFSPQFQQKFDDNESFKSLNRKMTMIPSFLIIGHVLLNRNKKWFRLTVNAPLIRYSLVGLLMLHLSTNVLYIAAYRDLISRNRERIQKIVVREQFLSGNGGVNNTV